MHGAVSEMQAPAESTWNGTDVDTTTIEGHISRLWRDVTSESAFPGAVRTSILNLVVYTRDGETASRLSDELRENSRRHPSRTIILVGDRLRSGSSVDADVSVYCSGGSGGARALCYEEIRITGHGRVADHLASVVIPLLIPELPTYLWWPSQPPFGHRTFHRLLSIADQLVIDSAQFHSPGDGLANIARLCFAKQGVNDFNWSRMAPWRDVLVQFFDGPAWAPYAYGIRSVLIEIGSGPGSDRSPTAALLLLSGWVASRLGWEPETTLDGLATQDTTISVLQGDRVIPIDLVFAEYGPSAAGRVVKLEIVSQPKGMPPARFTVERIDDGAHARVTMRVHEGAEVTRVVPLAIQSDTELLTGELELAGHDRLYENVVDMASRMAGREIWMPT
jgi:glucose-6-phosphate dehydrogenase assembly protein OpcA